MDYRVLLYRFFTFFFIFLMLNTALASSVMAREALFDDPPVTTGFNCSTSELTEAEANSLLDLDKNGFSAQDVGSGAPGREKDELQNNEIIIADLDTNTGIKQEMDNAKIEPYEVSHLLNNYIKGAFAFGIVLDDSMRAGKCNSYTENCHVIGKDLTLRNSGAGIQETAVNVYEDFKQLWDDNQNSVALTTEQNEALRSRLAASDENILSATKYSRVAGEMMPNSVLAEYFDARMQTNCTSSACVINSYSLFEKYYNSWYSSQMVLSNFGPTMVNTAKRAFGYLGRRQWPWRLAQSKLMDKIYTSRFFQPSSFLGQAQMKAWQTRIDKYGMGEMFNDLTSGLKPGQPLLIQTEGAHNWINQKLAAPGGYLDQIAKQGFTAKKETVRAFNTLRRYTAASHAVRKSAEAKYNSIAAKYAYNSPQEIAARIEYGRQYAKIAVDYDNVINLDWPQMWAMHSQSNMAAYGVKDYATKEVKWLYEDPRNMRKIFEKFIVDGHFKDFTPKNWLGMGHFGLEWGTKNPYALQIYAAKPNTKPFATMAYAELEEATRGGKMWDAYVELGHGVVIPLKNETLGFIKGKGLPKLPVYRGASAVPVKEMTAEELAGNITTSRATHFFTDMSSANSQRMYDTVVERNFAGRRYTSLLDKAFAEEQELMKKYFSLKGAVKWTVVPYGYWWVKKGGGVKALSGYMLPDTWHDLQFEIGTTSLYGDAYIDFFANEGSDQGDMFVQLLNKLPWKLVLNELSDQFNPIKSLYDKLTKNELRSEVENLAYYVSGPDDCATCTMVINSEDMKRFQPNFQSGSRLMSYLLEDTISEDAQGLGQTLISFAHHMNLVGKRTDGEGGNIDLQQAIKEKKTCTDAVKELIEDKTSGLFLVSWIPGFDKFATGTSGGVGGVLSTMETLSYLTFNWAGIFTTIYMQTMVIPKLQDCVDTEEGYYTHYFLPTKEEEKKQEDLTSVSTEKVSEMVDKGKSFINSSLQGTGDSFTQDAAQELGQQIENFAGGTQENDIVQATLSFSGSSNGSLDGKQLFYLWVQPGGELGKSRYVTEGQTVLTDEETGTVVVIDNETGKITVNGEEVVSNEDHTRLAYTNLAVPAIEIPHTLTKISLPVSDELMFEINASGEAFVMLDNILECIRSGVKEQTGLEMKGTSLLGTFGKVEAVVTDSHPNISFLGDKIIANGAPRKIAEGSSTKLQIHADRNVQLLDATDQQPAVGKLLSIQLKNGQIIYKPETNELLVWLRHHEDAILSQNDVTDMKANLVTDKNPDTGCEEPAVQLEVQGDPDSPLSMYKTDQFNTSLEHLGPFQVFDTEKKRYIIYTGPPPECEEHLKIIDKETGEVIDMVGNFEQTPTGLKFTDENGRVHTLDFSAENGIPKLSYDGAPAEIITRAQGRNGSFWYDPKNGLWYAENAQMLPLIDAFKQLGMATRDRDGDVSSRAEGNIMNVQVGGAGEGWLNVPSLPENAAMLLAFISAILFSFILTRRRIEKVRIREK